MEEMNLFVFSIIGICIACRTEGYTLEYEYGEGYADYHACYDDHASQSVKPHEVGIVVESAFDRG